MKQQNLPDPGVAGRTRRLSLIADPQHGPLPALLLVLTVVTGVVDAVSILSLGRMFVANMTGNVVFVGFALAGAPGFSLSASLSALAGFLLGAAAGGVLINRLGAWRGVLLRAGSVGELGLLVLALAVAVLAGSSSGTGTRAALAAIAAISMGLQNAVVRRLAVPDLTTTVLTMTLTGIAADLRTGGRTTATVTRLLAVATMLGGAICGALLVLYVSIDAALALAAGTCRRRHRRHSGCAAAAGTVAVKRRSARLRTWTAPSCTGMSR